MPTEFMKKMCAGAGTLFCVVQRRTRGECSEIAECFTRRAKILPHSGSDSKNRYNVGLDFHEDMTSQGGTHQEPVAKRPISPRWRR